MVHKLRNKTIILFATLAFLLVAINTVSAMPLTPMSIDGDVMIDGESAPAGTVVTAEMGGFQVDEYVVQSVGKYILTIEGQSDDTGKTINFLVNGKDADKTGVWESGSIVTIDLSISSSSSNSDNDHSSSSSSSNSYTDYTSENNSESEDSDLDLSSENETIVSEDGSENVTDINSDLPVSTDNSSSSKETPGFTAITSVLGLMIICTGIRSRNKGD